MLVSQNQFNLFVHTCSVTRYALSPAVKRRRQSMPNVGLHVTPAQLHHLNYLKLRSGSKRNSCAIQ